MRFSLLNLTKLIIIVATIIGAYMFGGGELLAQCAVVVVAVTLIGLGLSQGRLA